MKVKNELSRTFIGGRFIFIYLIVNHEIGKYYVGQHKGNSLKAYLQRKLSAAKHHEAEGSHLYNSMRKHPDPKLWFIHALRSDIQTREELNQTEIDFIVFLRAQNSEFGYNLSQGGAGNSGRRTTEVCAKMTEVIKKIWANPQTRAKQSETIKKLWSDPVYHARITEAVRVSKLRPEVRDKLSEAAKKKWANPEFKSHRAKIDEEKWADPQVRENCRKAHKRVWSNPEKSAQIRAKMVEASRKRWF